MNDDQISELVEITVKTIKQQATKYERIVCISQTILDMTDDFTDVERYLEGRKALFRQLDSINHLVLAYRKTLAEFLALKKDSWADILGIPDFAGKQALDKSLRLLKQIINDCITVDEKAVRYLEENIVIVQKELTTIGQYKELEQAYLDRPEKFPEPSIFDTTK